MSTGKRQSSTNDPTHDPTLKRTKTDPDTKLIILSGSGGVCVYDQGCERVWFPGSDDVWKVVRNTKTTLVVSIKHSDEKKNYKIVDGAEQHEISMRQADIVTLKKEQMETLNI